jgi:hypothetical protein
MRVAERKTRLTFETDATMMYRGEARSIVIEVPDGHTVALRLKGTRQRLLASWEGIYVHAAKREAERQRAERKITRGIRALRRSA